jgi:hypothetical protein
LPDVLPPAPPVPVSYLTGLGSRVRAPTLSLEDQLSLVALLRMALDRPREHVAAVEFVAHRQRLLTGVCASTQQPRPTFGALKFR